MSRNTLASIPLRARLIFVLGLLAMALIAAVALPLREAIAGMVLAAAVLAIALVDADRMIIPDRLSLPLVPLGLLATGGLVDPVVEMLVRPQHVAGAIVGATAFWAIRETYYRVRGRDGLGLGDVKLAAVAGAWVGVGGLPSVLLLASLSAIVVVLVAGLARGRRITGTMRVPFGVFLAPAIWIAWFGWRSGWLDW